MQTYGIDLDTLQRLGFALADQTRCRILLELMSGTAYPAELAEHLGTSRANISNHLACLRGCGLVVTTPEGRRMRYELADERLGAALGQLSRIGLAADPGHAHLRPSPDEARPSPAAAVQ